MLPIPCPSVPTIAEYLDITMSEDPGNALIPSKVRDLLQKRWLKKEGASYEEPKLSVAVEVASTVVWRATVISTALRLV